MPSKRRHKSVRTKTQEFERKLLRLKKAGLYSGQTKGAKQTKSRKNLLRKFSSVASGDAHVVTVKPSMAQAYKKARVRGVRIIGDKAIVDRQTGYTKARIVKGVPLLEDMVARVKPLKRGEIESIILPVHYSNIAKFIGDIPGNPAWNALKTSGERFTFKINGAPAYGAFGTLTQLSEYLQHYKSVQRAENNPGGKGSRQFWDIFELVRIRAGEMRKFREQEGE